MDKICKNCEYDTKRSGCYVDSVDGCVNFKPKEVMDKSDNFGHKCSLGYNINTDICMGGVQGETDCDGCKYESSDTSNKDYEDKLRHARQEVADDVDAMNLHEIMDGVDYVIELAIEEGKRIGVADYKKSLIEKIEKLPITLGVSCNKDDPVMKRMLFKDDIISLIKEGK